MHDEALKRVFDLAVSAVGLVVTAPIQILVALAVAGSLRRPVLFHQVRPGRDGKPFTLVKFRTMRLADPQRGLVSDADRLTRLGRLLRATSLDELPTLTNVLRGDMSVVGPRPLLMEYLPLYTAEQARRHEVRPGITGLAQINGRNVLGWEDRLALDVEYVRQRSFALDMSIVLRTFGQLLRTDQTSEPGQSTMSPFSPGVPQ